MARTWPAVALLAAATIADATLRSARLYLIEQALCRDYYGAHSLDTFLPDEQIDEQLCKLDGIQAEMSMIIGVLDAFTLLGGLLGTPLATGLAPVVGLRRVITINVFAMCAAAVFSTLVFFQPDTFDIRMIWLTGCFQLVGGGTPARNALLYMYLAQRTLHDELSETFYILSTLLLAMSLIGTAMGAILLAKSVWLLCCIGVSFCLLGFLLVPFLEEGNTHADPPVLVDTPFTPLIRPQTTRLAAGETRASKPLQTWSRPLKMILEKGRHESRESMQVMLDLLDDRWTLVTMLIYMCDETAIYIRVIFPQWASKHFAWTLAQVHAVTALQILITGCVLLFLPRFNRLFLLPRLSSQRLVDHWAIQWSLRFNIVGLILASVAPVRWMYVAALAMYNMGAALPDALRSFVTSSVQDEKQIQKLYTGISMVEAVAGLFGTFLWSMSFAAGLQYGGIPLARICFFAAAGLFALSLYMTGRLKRVPMGKTTTLNSTGGTRLSV